MKNIVTRFKSGSSLVSRIFRALFYSLFGTAGAKCIQLCCGIFISRTIGKDYYGEYSMINSTVSLFVLFAGAGVEATLTRYISLYRNNVEKLGKISGTIIASVTIFALLISTFLGVFSNKVSIWSCGNTVLSGYLKITAMTVFFTVIAAVFRSFLIGLEKYRNVAWGELIAVAVYAIVTIFMTREFGLNGSIISLAILHCIRMIYFLKLVIQYCSENSIKMYINFDWEIIEILLKFTLPAFVSSIFVIPVNWLLNSIITITFGFAELSVYSVAMQWKTIITYIPNQMNQLRPIFTDLYAKSDYKKLNKLLFRCSAGSFALVAPFVIIGIIFSEFLLSFYGSDYVSGSSIFSIIIFTMIPYSIQMQIGSYLQAVGKMWYGLFLNIIWALVYVLGALGLMKYGSIGIAIAYFISYTSHCVISVVLVLILQRKGHRDEKIS